MERWRRDNALYEYIKQYNFNRSHVKFTDYDYNSNIFTYYIIDDTKLLMIKSFENDDKLKFETYEPIYNLLCSDIHNNVTYNPIIHRVYVTIWVSPANEITQKETCELSKVPSYLNSKIPYQNYEYTQVYSMDKYRRICIDIQETASIERINNKITKLKNENYYSYEVYKQLHENKFNSLKPIDN